MEQSDVNRMRAASELFSWGGGGALTAMNHDHEHKISENTIIG